MDHFSYKDGQLHAENVALADIATSVGTPAYVYSSATLTRHYQVFKEAFGALNPLVCFAVKANSNQAVLKTLANLGSGADVVSLGELERATRAGIPGERIVFSGVGKRAPEMRRALELGIRQFNVESEPELEVLNAVAEEMGLIAPVALRVNPDVDAGTHEKISTGKAENKFGISWKAAPAVYDRIKEMPHIKAVGVDVHIGSQLTDLAPFEEAFKRVIKLVENLRDDGHDITQLDLGGGLGIPYESDKDAPPAPSQYGAMVQRLTKGLGLDIILEPGRLIAGNAGILLSEMIYVKKGDSRQFYILDAAMNDLARPAMYGAHHDFQPVREDAASKLTEADFVGPVCETGDTFAKQRETAALEAGELVAIRSAGAYGAVMSNSYNTRPLIAEVLVNGDEFAVIRPRISVEQLIAQDTLPDWLDD